MESKHKRLLEKRHNHWYLFADGELDHTFACINELKNIEWAPSLSWPHRASHRPSRLVSRKREKVDTREWLQNWDKLQELRTSFFEVRYAFDLYKRGVVPIYEKKTLADSSVDFEITLSGKIFNVELVSTLQTESMSKQTKHISAIAKLVATNSADEVRKVQSKIVRKVAKENKKTDTFVPHKFLNRKHAYPCTT